MCQKGLKLFLLVSCIYASACVRFAELADQTAPVLGGIPGHRVTGKDCMFSLFGVIPFGEHPTVEAKAIAIRKSGGDALVDVEIQTDWIWCLIGTTTCVRVTGRGAGMLGMLEEQSMSPATSVSGTEHSTPASLPADPNSEPKTSGPMIEEPPHLDCRNLCARLVVAKAPEREMLPKVTKICSAECGFPSSNFRKCLIQAGENTDALSACGSLLGTVLEVEIGTAEAFSQVRPLLRAWNGRRVRVELKSGEKLDCDLKDTMTTTIVVWDGTDMVRLSYEKVKRVVLID